MSPRISSATLKKAGLALSLLAVTAIIGYFIVTLFFTSPVPEVPETPDEPAPAGDGLPQAGPGTPGTGEPDSGPGALPDTGPPPAEPMTPPAAVGPAEIAVQGSFPSLNQNDALQFYNPIDNRFYALNAAGEVVRLSDQQFYSVSDVTWSPAGDKAVIEYPDGSNIRYDFAANRQVTLPRHWEDFAFSPQGNQLVAKSLGLDPDNRWLIISNDDGSQAQAIEPLGNNASMVIPSWSPNNQTVAMFVDGVDFNRKEVYFIGQHGENFKSIMVEGRDFRPLWSPNGQQLVYSVYSADNDYKPVLWAVDAQGDAIGANRRPLGLNTWADKCIFGSAGMLYCAVPERLERGAGMLPEISATTPDLLYRLNPATGLRELIAGNLNASIKNLSISPDGKFLYYLENGTNRLMKLPL